MVSFSNSIIMGRSIFNSTKNYNFIKTYLHNLNDDDKIKLNEYEIDSDLFPLFNYPSLIKCINTNKIGRAVTEWVENALPIRLRPNFQNFSNLIYKLLFKIFIENNV